MARDLVVALAALLLVAVLLALLEVVASTATAALATSPSSREIEVTLVITLVQYAAGSRTALFLVVVCFMAALTFAIFSRASFAVLRSF